MILSKRHFIVDSITRIFYYCVAVSFMEVPSIMATLDRWEPVRGSYDSQLNRLFNDFFGRTSQEQNLTPWVPAVDILENEHELVVKADLPDIKPEELDIRVENNILTLRGER